MVGQLRKACQAAGDGAVRTVLQFPLVEQRIRDLEKGQVGAVVFDQFGGGPGMETCTKK